MKCMSVSVLLIAMGLSGCMQMDPPSRGAMSTPDGLLAPGPLDSAQQSSASRSSTRSTATVLTSHYDVMAVNVSVPQSLVVSEANSFLPKADIVWRGDAPGDRYAQVTTIFQNALATGTSTMISGRKVVLDVEVTRFHCLTEKTRFTIGGTHAMHFMLTVRDAETNAVIEAPRLIKADVHGAGGSKAMAEEAAGRTQKVVVSEFLAQTIRRELSVPVSAVAADAALTRMDSAAATIVQ